MNKKHPTAFYVKEPTLDLRGTHRLKRIGGRKICQCPRDWISNTVYTATILYCAYI